ncbi:two-component sensor histidine kinase [Paraburkholderia acidicola]|uniref:histidine kinase n=1 Tax=Paraburkholderia acidicola TaxID=1912599 RepID=A0A2A4EP33_9BURK|nr:ATP-binding protein [Paraburkholderia acidicola]PCE22198.1 two-component sensor histidine kinase [Paraburkholderia acidicola]
MRVWPRSLFGRSMLLLFALIVASELCTIAIYVLFVQRPRIDDAAAVEAAQIVLIERLLVALPPGQRHKVLADLNGVRDDALPPNVRTWRPPSGYAMQLFFERLQERLPPGVEVRWDPGPERRIWVGLPFDDGNRWIVLPAVSGIAHTLEWSLIALLLMVVPAPALGAYVIHRRIEGPLTRLSRAAASVGRGVWPEAVSVKGPFELTTVADAFNGMVASLAAMESTRAEMLAGISHDIRTPLTKLRMALAAPESFDAPIASAERFVEEIDAIVQQFADFARGGEGETPVEGDLNALIEQLAADYAGLGRPFELALERLPPLSFRPVSMQRLLMNLMQNAVVYGRTGLSVVTRCENGWVIVTVEDRGPGVPASLLPLLKQPFKRGSSTDEKGTGLGLAIAERIARQHGGSVELRLRDGGGLAVDVRLRCG